MLLLILGAWLAQATPAPPASQQPQELQLLTRWLRSVQRHEAARPDAEASTIAVWSRDDLRAVVATLQSLRDALVKAAQAGAPKTSQEIRTRSGGRLSLREAQALLGLTAGELEHGDLNRLLKCGAMLHADIAMLSQEGLIAAAEPSIPGTPPARTPVRVSDGLVHGADEADRHWTMARALLDLVAPAPGEDDWVHRWYRAAAARMRGDSLLASAEPLLERASALFPKDAAFPFYGGCLHEVYASPSIQAVFASRVPLRASRPPSSLPAFHWNEAARLLSNALSLEPSWAEARLRYGRVLGQLGRHKEAATELRRALGQTDDLPLVYWGSLFLGAEAEVLGRDAEARTAYERARTLRPGAQAPRWALSALARRAGDRAGALAELRAVLALPSDEVSRYDPLWDYFLTRTSEAAILFGQLRAEVAAGGQQAQGARK
jgi:hypothetical protein